jgi:putative protease
MAEEKLVGKIVHFYTNIGVGIVELTDKLNAGDKVHVKGGSTDFEQVVDSMQIEHQNVETAKKGESIGVKLSEKVKEGDEVYKVNE